ncbi:MAG: hypothetical protein Q8R36_01615 [bacterium]|nr:hypothetical protein [bacterium]
MKPKLAGAFWRNRADFAIGGVRWKKYERTLRAAAEMVARQPPPACLSSGTTDLPFLKTAKEPEKISARTFFWPKAGFFSFPLQNLTENSVYSRIRIYTSMIVKFYEYVKKESPFDCTEYPQVPE